MEIAILGYLVMHYPICMTFDRGGIIIGLVPKWAMQ